jgi:hypothetical protein
LELTSSPEDVRSMTLLRRVSRGRKRPGNEGGATANKKDEGETETTTTSSDKPDEEKGGEKGEKRKAPARKPLRRVKSSPEDVKSMVLLKRGSRGRKRPGAKPEELKERDGEAKPVAEAAPAS